MAHIEKVTATVEFDDGGSHTFVIHQPDPVGGNPRYLTQQLDRALDDIRTREAAVIAAIWPAHEQIPTPR